MCFLNKHHKKNRHRQGEEESDLIHTQTTRFQRPEKREEKAWEVITERPAHP